jgi:hypothetical protein
MISCELLTNATSIFRINILLIFKYYRICQEDEASVRNPLVDYQLQQVSLLPSHTMPLPNAMEVFVSYQN